MIAGLGPGALALAAASVVCGVLIRSTTGFGGSLVIAAGLTLVLDPDEAVPVVLLVDLPIGLAMLPTTLGRAPRRTTVPAIVAMAVTTPVGVVFLDAVPATPMKLAIGLVVIVSTAALTFTGPPSREGSPTLFGFAGAIGGFLNGATSAGGPPLILAHYSCGTRHEERRAALSLTFLAMDAAALVIMTAVGIVDGTALARAAVLLPFAVGAPLVVDRPLSRLPGERVRPVALAALFAIGATSVVGALAG